MKVKIQDLLKKTTYFVSSKNECKDRVDLSAYLEAVEKKDPVKHLFVIAIPESTHGIKKYF